MKKYNSMRIYFTLNINIIDILQSYVTVEREIRTTAPAATITTIICMTIPPKNKDLQLPRLMQDHELRVCELYLF